MLSQGPLYDDIFKRLEKARWNLSDIPFHDIDKSQVSQETLTFLRVNCMLELSALYAERMFLRDFRELPDFCQFTSIWYYEEMKHYLVLREYLKMFDLEPDATQFTDLDVELAPAPWPATLALHYCGELRLGMWYHAWSDTADEPVLSSIYQLIGNDEFRHAACYKSFMERALAADSSRLLSFVQAAKWMLVNPTGDKHPTTMKSASADHQAVTDRIPGSEVLQARIHAAISSSDEDRLREQVLTTFSRLSGRTLKSLGDLSKLSRELWRPAGDLTLAQP
jgi:hypothetical protein